MDAKHLAAEMIADGYDVGGAIGWSRAKGFWSQGSRYDEIAASFWDTTAIHRYQHFHPGAKPKTVARKFAVALQDALRFGNSVYPYRL